MTNNKPRDINRILSGIGRLETRLKEIADQRVQVIETNNFHPRFRHDYEPRSLAIQVRLINKRMVAQRSRFVVCGDDRRPLETQYPDVFDKIELPSTTFDDAARFLRLAGVDALTMFPDHEGFGLKRREALHRYKKLLAKYAKPGP